MMRSERKTEKMENTGKMDSDFSFLILLVFMDTRIFLQKIMKRQVVSWIGQTEKRQNGFCLYRTG